jgi:hypothetical protein
MDLNKMTRRFILGEGKDKNITNYIQALRETLSALQPRTQTDYRRLEIAKEHLVEIRKISRRLQERVNLLEEQIEILEESKRG